MKSISRLVTLFISVFMLLSVATASEVDTVETFSPSMNKKIKAVVITPQDYGSSGKLYPSVYLLHGYGSNYSSFVNALPAIKNYADAFGIILICPDGNIGSWYFDSPVDPQWKYETYVSRELINWIDKKYRTIKDRSGRGITGFSMGGHGAMYLSFKHQDVFGVAGSMSGGVDFRPFPRNWEIARRLGTYSDYPERWEQNTVINMISLLKPNSLKLIIDCGTEDFFYQVNLGFHEKLLESGIPHDFIIRPGAHNWPYWNNAIVYQLLFMSKYFAEGK